MKKLLLTSFFVALLIPQIVLAAWWNPLSWFNNWSFLGGEDNKEEAQELEQRIAELEKKIAEQEQEPVSANQQTEILVETTEITPTKISNKSKDSTETVITKKVITPTQTSSNSANKSLPNSELVSLVAPSVLYIKTPNSSGSGVVIDGKYILTNAHVVENYIEVEAITSSNRGYTTSLRGIDEYNDLALLYAPSLNLRPLNLGNSANTKTGDNIYLFGYPLGILGEEVSFKEGTLSRRQTFGGISYLETSTEAHPGNSGGPLVNETGEIIGILTGGKTSLSGALKYGIDINFAKPIIEKMKQGMILRKNKVSSPEEQEIYDEFNQKYKQVSSNESLVSAINESYSDPYFKYLNDNLYSGGDSLKKSYLENLIKGIDLIAPAVEYLKFVNQGLNSFFATNQNITASITNSYQKNRLDDFESYSLKKIKEYNSKLSEIYIKRKEIEQELGNLSGTAPATIKSQEQYLLGLINYVASEKNTLLDMLGNKKFF